MHLNFRRILLLSFVIAGNPEAEDGSNKLEDLKIGLKYGIALYKDTKYKDFFLSSNAALSQNCAQVQVKAGGLCHDFGSSTNCVHLARIKASDLSKTKILWSGLKNC